MADDQSVVGPCPNIFQRVWDLRNPSLLLTWAELGYSQTTKDHSLCSKEECRANDLHPDTYATKHTKDGCACTSLRTDPKTLRSIYEAGSFPVVSLSKRNGELRLDVQAYRPGLHYIAISHAISDGRGNPTDSALPLCQLRQIDEDVRLVYTTTGPDATSGWFWMDTLCIPSHLTISTEYTQEMRASFKQSTEKAVGTLVFDADIQKLDRNFTYRQAFLRIHYSSWSSRMWTLQEAVLTPRVFFQLQHGFVELEDIVKRFANDEDSLNVPTKPLLAYIRLRQYYYGTYHGDAVGSADHLAMLHEALKDRRTSNKADKRLIVANLLGMDIASLPEATFQQVLWQEAALET